MRGALMAVPAGEAGQRGENGQGRTGTKMSESLRASQALLLNATHEPLALLATRRAMMLVLSGKADCLLARADEGFRSPTGVTPAPAVLRLCGYVRIPFRGPVTITRAGILRRDGRRCVYCRGPGTTIDHVVPRSRGGAYSWGNCVACCVPCNSRKADRLLTELGWATPTVPAPPGRFNARLRVDTNIDPSWAPWLSPTV